ncbi:OLC1v1008036C1 [Oldenlandia corymbosa var. corymbosa]|uniref:OLC1v1008036C1 n=1 Tax=Oldenlandia corymbosa var. corymbosa TaxID=529605 RepID=A0AAV1DKQ9_OLDCO|nr:OLC1v1008036C1 [Oldenlandia corymbosa var. corymbosa]
MESIDERRELLLGQAEIWKQMYSFANSVALKCVVELGIPNIQNSHNRSLSLPEIASNFTNSSSPNILYLSRVMDLLVHNKIFTSTTIPINPENEKDSFSSGKLYGLTPASRWLIKDENGLSLSPVVLLAHHGCEIYDLARKQPESKKLLHDGMVHIGNIVMDRIVNGIKEEAWEGLDSIVYVGGRTGHAIAKIVKKYPHIKGINFDLSHVIETAPEHAGVTHVAGSMFDAIPCG